jgi:hypothetical protein
VVWVALGNLTGRCHFEAPRPITNFLHIEFQPKSTAPLSAGEKLSWYGALRSSSYIEATHRDDTVLGKRRQQRRRQSGRVASVSRCRASKPHKYTGQRGWKCMYLDIFKTAVQSESLHAAETAGFALSTPSNPLSALLLAGASGQTGLQALVVKRGAACSASSDG